MSDNYPDELFENIDWNFAGGQFSSLKEFNNAVYEYGNDKEWHPDMVVLNVPQVKIILFMPRINVDSTNDISWDLPLEVILRADNSKSFTAGELFFKIHNAFVDKLESLKDVSFMFLSYLNNLKSETLIPTYELDIGYYLEEKYEADLNDIHDYDLSESVEIKDSLINCPSCHSHDWKRASFIYKAGLTHINTSSNSVGVGVSSGIGVGVSYSDTVGQHQTELSRLAAPPIKQIINRKLSFDEKIIDAIPMIVFFLCFCYFYLNSGETFWGFITAVLKSLGIFSVLVIIFKVIYGENESEWYRKEADRYQEEYEKWQKKKICMRCGTSFY